MHTTHALRSQNQPQTSSFSFIVHYNVLLTTLSFCPSFQSFANLSFVGRCYIKRVEISLYIIILVPLPGIRYIPIKCYKWSRKGSNLQSLNIFRYRLYGRRKEFHYEYSARTAAGDYPSIISGFSASSPSLPKQIKGEGEQTGSQLSIVYQPLATTLSLPIVVTSIDLESALSSCQLGVSRTFASRTKPPRALSYQTTLRSVSNSIAEAHSTRILSTIHTPSIALFLG